MKKYASYLTLGLCLHTSLAAAKPDELIAVDQPYQETYRPQFHYTVKKGWINDPCGLVYYAGEYHLFNDHNPFGNVVPGVLGAKDRPPSRWSHAVSRDLVHWQEMPIAILPDKLGAIFSGSGVVDVANTAGFAERDHKTLVLIYTSAGQPFCQSISYSNDRGRTWTKYGGNPVLQHVAGNNRDPKVIWHEPTKRWIMALFLHKNDFALFGSADLKQWQRLCDVQIPGTGECPDFFELPVDGDKNRKKWLFWGGNGNYRLGTFDGVTFTPETESLQSRYGANDYAAQTYSGIPDEDGRRIQMSWMRGGKYPGMPFTQQQSFPRELTVRTTPEGVRLFMEPVAEIETIRGRKQVWSDLALKPAEEPIELAKGELWEIVAELELVEATEIGLEIRGEKLRYDVGNKTLHCLGRSAPLTPQEGRIKLHVLVDRTSIEVFANDGRIAMCSCFLPDLLNRSLRIYAEGGPAVARSLTVYELRSAWTR